MVTPTIFFFSLIYRRQKKSVNKLVAKVSSFDLLMKVHVSKKLLPTEFKLSTTKNSVSKTTFFVTNIFGNMWLAWVSPTRVKKAETLLSQRGCCAKLTSSWHTFKILVQIKPQIIQSSSHIGVDTPSNFAHQKLNLVELRQQGV